MCNPSFCFSSPRSRARAQFLLLVIAVALAWPFSARAWAQSDAQLTLNQVEADGWPQVTVNLTLTGPDGKPLPGLNPSQFQVSEEGNPQPVTGMEVGPAKSVPLDIVLAIDVSGSMSADNKLSQAKQAANVFVAALRPQDSATILAFNEKVTQVASSVGDQAPLRAGLDTLQAGGNTAIYDALYSAAQVVGSAKEGTRRAIVLLTDGADTSSKFGAQVAADVARQTGALVYTVGVGPDANDAVLQDLARPSGGKYYKAPSAADLVGIYNAISLELDSQLFLKYTSSTRTQRSYQLVELAVTYKGTDGRVLTETIRYRPPWAALQNSDAGQTQPVVLAPLGSVTLPPAISKPQSDGQTAQLKRIDVTWKNLLAALLAGLSVIAAAVGLSVLLKPTATSRRVGAYLGRGPDGDGTTPGGPTSRLPLRIRFSLVGRLGGWLVSLSPKKYSETISNLLKIMGPPYRMTLGKFLGIQFALTLLLVGLALVLVGRSESATLPQVLLALLVAAGSGLYLPYFWIKRKVAQRQKLILRAVPGALDFLAINVEAGLGFDAALGQVARRWHNTLTDEFSMLLVDFRIGKDRKEAWKDMIKRTQVPELTSFITAMLQNEQVGISISTLLRTQADQMRIRRRQAAEESARTAPVKMLLPMVFFIFPGIFVIILGPAIPQFLTVFTNLGK